MSALKEAWDTLRAVASVLDKVAELSAEVRELRVENRELRDRLVRVETICRDHEDTPGRCLVRDVDHAKVATRVCTTD